MLLSPLGRKNLKCPTKFLKYMCDEISNISLSLSHTHIHTHTQHTHTHTKINFLYTQHLNGKFLLSIMIFFSLAGNFMI